MYVTTLAIPLRAGNATEARSLDTFVTAKMLTKQNKTKSGKFEIQEGNFWVNLSSHILSHPTERSKIQMTREEEGGEGSARLQKKQSEQMFVRCFIRWRTHI